MTREERKAMFIARATKHFDTPRIRREAAKLFDQKNPCDCGCLTGQLAKIKHQKA